MFWQVHHVPPYGMSHDEMFMSELKHKLALMLSHRHKACPNSECLPLWLCRTTVIRCDSVRFFWCREWRGERKTAEVLALSLVMDRSWAWTRPRDTVVTTFTAICAQPLPCVGTAARPLLAASNNSLWSVTCQVQSAAPTTRHHYH